MSRATGGRTGMLPRGAVIVTGVAVVLSIVGALLDARRFAFSYLAAYAAVLSLVLGALSLLMIARVTGARWLEPLLPLIRATAATLPLLAVLFLPILAARHLLYPWVPPLGPMADAVRERVLAKSAYLNVPFFLGRAALYFVVWIGLAELLLRGDAASRLRWSALGLPPFAFAVTFASIDWIMSLLPAWWSTIFGLYVWSGGFLAALACTALLAARGGLLGPSRGASTRSNTLGKLLLTFVLFWGYVGFSQFLVIWIGDVPLEASWLAPRMVGSWAGVGIALLAGHFAVPFALLLPRAMRERPARLAGVAALLLLMHWVDGYWLVLPALTPAGLAPHWLDLATVVALAGLTLAFAAWRLQALESEAEEAGEGAPAWW